MIGKKQVAIGVTSLAVAGAAFVPGFAAAGGTWSGVSELASDAIPRASSVALTQQSPDGDGVGPAHGRGGFGLRGGFGFRGHGVIGGVLEEFGVSVEDYREAASTVRDQLADSRPEVDRPLDEDEIAALEAFAVTKRAAIAEELGIDATAFEQAYQDAKAEAQAAREAARAERQQALADALGVTVEDLQAAFESLRGQFGPQTAPATSGGGA